MNLIPNEIISFRAELRPEKKQVTKFDKKTSLALHIWTKTSNLVHTWLYNHDLWMHKKFDLPDIFSLKTNFS